MAKDGSEQVGDKLGINTRLAHSGNNPHDYFGFVNPPVVHASTVLFRDAASMAARSQKYTYGTRGTPTTDALAQAIDALEGSAGTIVVPSGLAAVTVPLLAFVSAGDHLLIVDSVYHPTRNFADTMLKRLGVEVEYYAPDIGAGIAALIRPNTKVVFTESPASNTFEVQDIPAIAKAAHAAGAIVMMDNTWATPLYSARSTTASTSRSMRRRNTRPAIPTCCLARSPPTRTTGSSSSRVVARLAAAPGPTTSTRCCAACALWACAWSTISAARSPSPHGSRARRV